MGNMHIEREKYPKAVFHMHEHGRPGIGARILCIKILTVFDGQYDGEEAVIMQNEWEG